MMYKRIFLFIVVTLLFFIGNSVSAATLHVSPETGVYIAGTAFSTNVIIDTQNKPVNAADGQLTFNPHELSVVNVSRASSIFNLWTQEPGFSNTDGTISFGGGSPTGYTGSAGTILSITFRSLAAGNPKITFKSGSVLAADGLGTNVLTSMSGASYTVSAKSDIPPPEYVAPANTPQAPAVTSSTHPDQTHWYKANKAELEWKVPSDVVSVRTLLDSQSATVPTKVYDQPITSRTLEDLPQGISYFHIQFKNKEGWGRITHYRLAIDSEAPSLFTITELKEQEATNPARVLSFEVKDISPVTLYRIQIDGAEPIEYKDEEQTKRYTLPVLAPGHHTIIVEAFDSAKNSLITTYSFDIASFEKPLFTEYPSRLNTGVIPAFKGTTRANAKLTVTVQKVGNEKKTYSIIANEQGLFTFIPDAPLVVGVYDINAVATDSFGATSDPSDVIRVVVEEPGFIKIGSFVMSVLSILIPLVALLLLMVFGCWYLWHRLSSWRRRVIKETLEVEDTMKYELGEVLSNLDVKVNELKESRKGKLTRAETALIEQIEIDVADARAKIHKEITDIENIVK